MLNFCCYSLADKTEVCPDVDELFPAVNGERVAL